MKGSPRQAHPDDRSRQVTLNGDAQIGIVRFISWLNSEFVSDSLKCEKPSFLNLTIKQLRF
jgi:hypothetical protein